jgi:hypothetical protein
MSAKLGMHALLIERSFHLGDGDRRNAIADEVGQRTRLGHEAVDAEYDGHGVNVDGAGGG